MKDKQHLGTLSNDREYTKFFRTVVDGQRVFASFGWTSELGYYVTANGHSKYRLSKELLQKALDKLGYEGTLDL